MNQQHQNNNKNDQTYKTNASPTHQVGLRGGRRPARPLYWYISDVLCMHFDYCYYVFDYVDYVFDYVDYMFDYFDLFSIMLICCLIILIYFLISFDLSFHLFVSSFQNNQILENWLSMASQL